jgi:hypothetical protein
MFMTGGSSPGAGSSSSTCFSDMVGKLLYASRMVNGPRKARMTVPGALPGLRSMLKGPLFQVCHENVPMPSSLPSSGGFVMPRGVRTCRKGAKTRPLSIGQ